MRKQRLGEVGELIEITRPAKGRRVEGLSPEDGQTLVASLASSCVHSRSVPLGDSQEPCPYAQGSRKFSCRLAVPEGDNSLYVVSLCVSNSAGSRSSSPQTFEGYGIREYPLPVPHPRRPRPL